MNMKSQKNLKGMTSEPKMPLALGSMRQTGATEDDDDDDDDTADVALLICADVIGCCCIGDIEDDVKNMYSTVDF